MFPKIKELKFAIYEEKGFLIYKTKQKDYFVCYKASESREHLFNGTLKECKKFIKDMVK